jgi:hypothetical protein
MKTLLVVLTLTGLVASAAAETNTVTETFSQTYALAATGSVQLSNVNGTVEIIAWDQPEVALEAEKRAPDAGNLARIHLNIDARPDRLVVKTEHEKTGWFGQSARGEVRYHLKVPAGVSLDKIEVVNADITVRGVRGAVRLESVNGGISATGLAGGARLRTVNGGVTAAFAAVASAEEISAETVNGSCELRLPKDAGAHLDLSSVNGGIRCTFPITLEDSGHHTLRGTIGASAGATIKVRTVNGGISVRSE